MLTVVMAVGSVVASLLASPTAAQPQKPPPPTDTVTIGIVKVHGSGCRPHTASVAVSLDNTAFTVSYSAYLAQVGVGAKKNDYRKDCQLKVKLDVPRGSSFAIGQVDYRGFAHLERGATSLERANFRFQGSAETPLVTHPLSGPFEDDWQATDSADSLAYAPCGKTHHLDIGTEVQVDAGSSNTAKTTSFMSMDSTDGSVETKTTYHLVWKPCR